MKFKPVNSARTSDPFEAFRTLVYQFGAQELAAQMGMKPGTLYNKADSDAETHHQPTLRDVVAASRITRDLRVLDALEAQFGRLAFDVDQFGSCSDEALLELFANYGAEGGEFCTAVRDALRKRSFSASDFVLIRSEAHDVMAALMTLVARLEGLVDDE